MWCFYEKTISKEHFNILVALSLQLNKKNEYLWNTHLAGCNAHKAIQDVAENSGITTCDDIDHIYTLRLQSFVTFVDGSSKHRQFQEGLPHIWPL
jgi:hypothetical protein